MKIPAVQSKKYSYADYLNWDDDNERCELINGVVHDMSPAPYTKHQRILFNLSGIVFPYFKGKALKAFFAPFDVRLPDKSTADQDIYTVVQPDLCVFCNPSRIDKRGAIGAPDWIVEILSRSTSKKDTTLKLQLYLLHGVREYWIINPEAETISVYFLSDHGTYNLIKLYSNTDSIPVNIFSDLLIDAKEVFVE